MMMSLRRLRTWGWKYRAVFSFTMLATGVAIAIFMVQHEAQRRVEGEANARRGLQSEIDTRRADRDAIDKAQTEQLAQLVEVNDKQNQIIRALLVIRRNNPDLFVGVKLPTVGQFDAEVGAMASGRAPAKPSRPKPAQPVPSKPHPTRPTPPKPTSPSPTPVQPTPVRPTPPPSVVVITPPPPAPAPTPLLPVPPSQIICGVTTVCLPPLGL